MKDGFVIIIGSGKCDFQQIKMHTLPKKITVCSAQTYGCTLLTWSHPTNLQSRSALLHHEHFVLISKLSNVLSMFFTLLYPFHVHS